MIYIAAIALALLSISPSYAGSGFALGGAFDATVPYQTCDYSCQLERKFQADEQLRLLQQNNQLLQDQADRQNRLDTQRLFGIRR